MTKYRLYVDEVGDTGLKRVSHLDHRFLSLTGVIAESNYVRRRIHPELEAIKVRYFDSHPDEPVVLHRREMVNGRRPFQTLADTETRAAFYADLLDLISVWDYRIITACLDKQAFVAAGLKSNSDPYQYCLGILVSEFGDWLYQCDAKGDVMIEARGDREDKELKRYFRTLYHDGVAPVADRKLQNVLTSRDVKISPKERNVSGLQVADLLALPSRYDILNERGLFYGSFSPMMRQVVAALSAKHLRISGNDHSRRFLP